MEIIVHFVSVLSNAKNPYLNRAAKKASKFYETADAMLYYASAFPCRSNVIPATSLAKIVMLREQIIFALKPVLKMYEQDCLNKVYYTKNRV